MVTMEELSKQVDSLKELKVLNVHQEFVFNMHLVPALNKVPSDIRESTIKVMNHYNKIWTNIITYLWRIHLDNKLTLEYLKANAPDNIQTLLEEAEFAIDDKKQEELGVEV